MKKQLLLFSTFLFLLLSNALVAQTLVHYWNFNNSGSETEILTPTLGLVAGAGIQHIQGGSSAIQTTSNTGNGFDTANPNARNGDPSGAHLRFNNPIGGALIFSIPTAGYQQIVVKYGTRRSGSGAGAQIIEYATDGASFIPFATINPVDGDPTLQTLDFSGISAANDNADFKIRITFEQGPGGTVGNNRFDNFTLEGITFGADTVSPVVTFDPVDGSTGVSPLVQLKIIFNEEIRLVNDSLIKNEDILALVQLREDHAAGNPVTFSGTYANKTLTLTPDAALINNKTYFMALLPNTVEDFSNNTLDTLISVQFTIIPQQTVFQAGDIVPIAYRMNATGSEDEVAFLTFVNILPGTKINMTDAKFTDNSPAQCPGGITWTSPGSILPAGSVFVVQNDAGSASVGTVTGSTFGLSSNGDQMLVYTGSNTTPTYITALSSNAWVTGAHTACGGSLSKLPIGLEDGISSINLSTAPGNTSGNTVNGYYNGPQTGTTEELRNAILDPLNWNGIGAGTAAQEWPAFNFPGPPSVVKAEVASASTIRLVFNNNLHLGSAGQLSNYTGIAGLSVATPTDNGALADTVTLIYQNAFSSGITYDLAVFGVADAEGRTMVDTFHYSFTYETQLGFENRFWVVTEGDGPVNIRLNLVNPAQTSVKLVYKSGGFSTAGFLDFSFENQTLEFTGTSELEINLEVPITDDNVEEQDEYFVLELVEPNGIALKGPSFITVYIQDNDRKAPEETLDIELSFVSRYAVDNPNGESGLAEIVAYDPGSKRLYTISTALKQFDIVDFSDPIAPQNVKVVDISPYGGGITSIAVKNGIVAACVPGINNEQENGKVVFFDPDGNFINQVTVGALPDMIVFTPDGQKVITANEGQPNDAYTIDPEGSISLIDISGGIAGLTQDQVFTIGFTAFNPQTAELVASGVRLLKTTSTLAQDLEPEYVTISEDSQKAWATLQENNAMAEIDLATKTVTAIWPLGVKDYHETGNGLDLSDRSNEILIANWPVKGFYLPDAVANYSLNGKTYLFTANEGDEKEYSGLNERTTVSAIDLDPVAFPNAAMLKENHNMGRFRVTNLSGDKDNDGDFDELFCVGARSFSIWDAESHTLVYDSGDDFEKITAEDPYTAPIFNADNEGNGFKGRSRAKGPEPEGIVLAPINGREFAFITLERIGGVMVYDVTDPFHPEFTDYVNSRDNTTFAGDNGPEGIIYIPGAISPDGKSYIITANELSGTLAIFEIKNVMTSVSNPVLSGSKIKIYPNPNGSGRAYFSEPTGYTLFDLNGVALKWDIQAQSVDLNGLPKGMYLVRLADGAVQKLIVD